MNKSEQLIACLEGEIAKRDETIARLEPQLNRAIRANYDLREELAACRIAVENCDLFRARIAELEADRDSHQRCAIQAMAELAAIKAREPAFMWHKGATEDESEVVDVDCACPCCVPLYAAPVSEAKAQGVVMPPSPYMPGSQPTDFTDYELGEIHGRIAMWEEVKRLNGAPAQQVSVPDGKVCVPVEVLRLYEFMAASFTPFTSQQEQIAISLRKAKAAMLAAAPAAPAADAWIPVSERLPGEDDQVLCWCEDETVAWAEVSSHHNSFFTDMTHELLPVTHWMPLPAAPIKIEANRHDQ